jgi:shikimate dehydrogenase
MDRYAVIGNPIAHSKSPRIHALFARQTGQDLSYEAILAPADGFVDTVERFRAEGGRGMNVTLPFKLEAWRYVDERSPRAERAGAVNTIQFRPDGTTLGDNTDGVGLLRDLTLNNGIEIEARQLLLLGAGGAVRGVLQPLLLVSPACLVIANRTVSRAERLRNDFTDLGDIEACGFGDLVHRSFDLVINATSVGLKGKVPPLPDDILRKGGCCYDMFYTDSATPFQYWALRHGALKALDGLGMLVEQAAESFSLWRGINPNTRSVIETLRTRE